MTDDALMKYRMMYRAKSYLDEMRRGLDPVSKQPVPEDSVIRQEKLIACFGFLSELLDELLSEASSQALSAAEPAMAKAPFALRREQLAQVKLSYAPIAVSTFVSHINGVVDKRTTKAIRGKDITGWLCEKGLLEERTVPVTRDEKEYLPSRYADGLGLLAVKKDGESGQPERYALKLDRQGQIFLLDHIEDIAAFAKENP